MRLTALQQWVFDNLEAVAGDSARWDPRFELHGKNVSHQMRGLLRQGLVAIDEGGRLSRSLVAEHQAPKIDPTVIRDLRALLLDRGAATSQGHRVTRDESETN